MNRIDALWNVPPPDTREIWEWAKDETDLPACYAVPGPFDADTFPPVKEVFRALKDPTVRDVIAEAAVQCLKTLIGEIFLLWTIDQNPGPTQWLQPTNEEAKEHAEERFKYLVKNCPRVHRYYTENRHDQKTTAVIFKHMVLRMEGASDLGNLQRKSVKTQVCSEVWQAKHWKPGHYSQAATRLTQFVHNSKRYTESQAGWENDDMDLAYKAGTQEELHFKCLGCGKPIPFKWTIIRDDGSRAGMRWTENEHTRRPNGEWVWSELIPTIRYECPLCGHGHLDDPITRRRIIAEPNIVYIPQNPSPDPKTRSFSWNQLAMPILSWYETKTGGIKRFLWANDQAKRGNEVPLIEFFQKVLAEPWSNQFLKQNQPPAIKVNEKWPNEFARFLTIDVQESEFWAMVAAWAKNGECRILWAGRLTTWGDIEAKQKEFEVYDGSVLVDSGYDTRKVYLACVKHGHKEIVNGRETWVCWRALKGEDRGQYPYRQKNGNVVNLAYSWPPSYGDPMAGDANQDKDDQVWRGYFCPLVCWSNPTIKNIAAKIRDGKGAGLTIPENVTNDLMKHLYAERRIRVYDKLGMEQWKWENIGKRPNHLWDCFCEQIVAASMAGLIGEEIGQ